jgi:hypothetical protein
VNEVAEVIRAQILPGPRAFTGAFAGLLALPDDHDVCGAETLGPSYRKAVSPKPCVVWKHRKRKKSVI